MGKRGPKPGYKQSPEHIAKRFEGRDFHDPDYVRGLSEGQRERAKDPVVRARLEDNLRRGREVVGSREPRRDSTSRQGMRAEDWRQAVLKRDNLQCQQCGSEDRLVAHHIEGWKGDGSPSDFDVNNGLTLCEPCHNRETNRQKQGKTYEEIYGLEEGRRLRQLRTTMRNNLGRFSSEP
jgi:5-methylcytosine-specific restriction endonuclease McrA